MSTETKTIKLFVTGLGPCGALIDNPASIATRQLKDLVLTSPPPAWSGAPTKTAEGDTKEATAQPLKVEITYAETENAYRQFNVILTAAHESGKYDAMVHISGTKSSKAVEIEKGSNRLGYSRKDFDVERKLAPRVEGGFGLEGDVDRWETSIDVDALVAYLKDGMGFTAVKVSNDAGNYTGGYIFGKSLQLAAKQAAITGKKAIPTVLVNLPPMKDYDCEKEPQGLLYAEKDYVELLKGVCWNVAQQAAGL